MSIKTRLQKIERKLGVDRKKTLVVPVKHGGDYELAKQKVLKELNIQENEVGLVVYILKFSYDDLPPAG